MAVWAVQSGSCMRGRQRGGSAVQRAPVCSVQCVACIGEAAAHSERSSSAVGGRGEKEEVVVQCGPGVCAVCGQCVSAVCVCAVCVHVCVQWCGAVWQCVCVCVCAVYGGGGDGGGRKVRVVCARRVSGGVAGWDPVYVCSPSSYHDVAQCFIHFIFLPSPSFLTHQCPRQHDRQIRIRRRVRHRSPSVSRPAASRLPTALMSRQLFFRVTSERFVHAVRFVTMAQPAPVRSGARRYVWCGCVCGG